VIQLPGYTIMEDDVYGRADKFYVEGTQDGMASLPHHRTYLDAITSGVPRERALVRLQDTPLWAMWMWLRVHDFGLHWEYELGILNYMLIHGPVTLHLRVAQDDEQGWIGTNAS
jgi:hypothetical protein